MTAYAFDQLLDAAIDAMDGWDDFVEEAVEAFLMQVEDHDWVTARS